MAYHGNSIIKYIDSEERNSGSHTNFSIDIDLPKNSYDKVALLQLSCPKSFYNFRKDRNTFILIEKGVEILITVPEGNYSVSSLNYNLTNIMTEKSLNGWKYTLSYPGKLEPDTGKITFGVENNDGQPTLKFVAHCWQQLGFMYNQQYTFVNNTLKSANYVSLAPINRVYVKSSLCNTSDKSILQEVLETFPDSSFIYYENTNIESNAKSFTGQSSRTFSFTITDRFGVPVDTNGLNLMMSILFFKKDNTSELHKEELMINNLERMISLSEKQAEVNIKHLEGVKEPEDIMDASKASHTEHLKSMEEQGGLRPENFSELFPSSSPEDKKELDDDLKMIHQARGI
mgnify:CR=1 FL=1|tara:strand:+ start:556 stop:1587 length:1032 start_codon:yes stop_codon:yes gene_type:complete